jgi:hypothetical protein
MKIKILFLSHTVTALIIFAFRIFMPSTDENIYNNIYRFFNLKLVEVNSLVYFYLIMSLLANGFLDKRKVVSQIVITLLLIINLLIIFISIKSW